MRIAILADLHGNFVALRAVLDRIERESIDLIVALGDIAEVGPQPVEAIECIRSLGCPAVLGNTDAHLATRGALGDRAEGPVARLVEIDRWTLDQVADEHLDWLGSLPPTLDIDLGGSRAMLCYHGSPRSYDDWIEPGTPEAELASMLESSEALVMAGGHTHHQMLRRWKGGVLVNPGSVGLALLEPSAGSLLSQLLGETSGPVLAARAEYAILSATDKRLDIALQYAEFDVDELLDAAASARLPNLDWWASKWARSQG
jgi:predicted phosphodiesterase